MKWWIEHTPPSQARGKLQRIYERYRLGEATDNIILAHSPIPDALDSLMLFYNRVMHGTNDLPYVEREMVAVTVSVLNRCHY